MLEGFGLVEVFALVVAIALFGVWIAAVVDVLKNEPNEGNDRIVWTIVVVFMHVIGAAIYFTIRRRQRIAQFGH